MRGMLSLYVWLGGVEPRQGDGSGHQRRELAMPQQDNGEKPPRGSEREDKNVCQLRRNGAKAKASKHTRAMAYAQSNPDQL